MNISETIKQNTQLQEPATIIDRIFVEMYLGGHVPTKTLAQHCRLPLPVVAAIRKEMVKSHLAVNDNGIRLNDLGTNYVQQQLGWQGVDRTYYLQLLDDADQAEVLQQQLASQLARFSENRPGVEVTLDQAFATPITSVRRAFKLLQEQCLVGQKILLLGDDDLTSFAIALLLDALQAKSQRADAVVVYEVDPDLRAFIQQTAEREHWPIVTSSVDFRQGDAARYRPQFDTVFVDPPYTLSGLKLFLSRAISSAQVIGGQIMLSFGEKDPNTTLEIQQLLNQQNLLLKALIPSFNYYDGAGVLGNRSNLYQLEKTARSYAVVAATANYTASIYTGTQQKRIRTYQCLACQTQIEVGPTQKIETIEQLKAQGCPNCGAKRFKLLKRQNLQQVARQRALGEHYLLELKQCQADTLTSVKDVSEKMLEIVQACQLTLVTQSFHQFKPWGVSGVIVLAESHFTIHTWPEKKYAAVDLFVCSPLQSEKQLIDLLQKAFEPGELTYEKVYRGELDELNID